MVINLTMLIVISALLFTGIENKTNLTEIKNDCHFGRPSDCLKPGFALLHPDKCEPPDQPCDKLMYMKLTEACAIGDMVNCDQEQIETLEALCANCINCDLMDPDMLEVETVVYIENC
mmetsp:Transcript_23048/g.28591  ORF Transcript_23048/g.28591 Transcript_23048/m.28591 type:complete len:118 (+) Transcript_23048:79-432(+)